MKAMIFDFNGTMVADTDLNRRAWGAFLEGQIGRSISDAEFLAHACGPSNAETLRHFCGEDCTDAEIARLAEGKERIYRRMCDEAGEHFRLTDGLAQLLDDLKARGVPFTIATSAGIGNLRYYFERLGLGRWFALERVIYEDGTFPAKPHPATYLRACDVLGASPADCVVVEDTAVGIRAAVRAGIGEIVAISTSHPAEALGALPGVSRVIDDFRGFTFP